MAALVKSRVPAALAAIAAVALAYADVAAQMLIAPQTGWHFAIAARWVWVSFAAAGSRPHDASLLCVTHA